MTNQEKNIRIAELLGLKVEKVSMIEVGRVHVIIDSTTNGCLRIPNYCEDWSQLMPLCIEHSEHLECGVSQTGDSYVARITDSLGFCRVAFAKSKQTALVDCLIAVLEAKEKEQGK